MKTKLLRRARKKVSQRYRRLHRHNKVYYQEWEKGIEVAGYWSNITESQYWERVRMNTILEARRILGDKAYKIKQP